MLLNQLLITDPVSTLDRETFWLSKHSIIEGAPVKINASSYPWSKCYTLKMEAGNTSYYFPYLGNGNAGMVNVHLSECYDGAIAITDPMNGCALEVRYNKATLNYVFYHDTNGISMPPLIRESEKIVCRIESSAYWDCHEIENIIKRKHIVMPYPSVQFICVYKSGLWHVGCSGSISSGQNGVQEIFTPRGGKYRGCFDCMRPLIQM